jgi:hypothetical protein
MSGPLLVGAVRGAVLRWIALAALAAGVATSSLAGGPLQVVNQQPVVYPNGGGSLTLNLDQGPLGLRTNAQAAAIVRNAIAMWNGVSTSTMRLSIGAPLAADYSVLNYSGIAQNYSDGLNPVIFDTDGLIIDAIFGAGAKSTIAGFAGSAYYTSGPLSGTYVEGRAVLNGALAITDATLTTVLAHELGHFFGLSHSQLDATQGLAANNFVLMYPIAYRTLQTLHEDDVAAVSALYPTASAASAYGQLGGTFTTAAGSPILGANIWVRENATGKVYSVVSDYLMQGTGYFRLSLPPGTYTLNAESIATNFVGGSGVGPYSASAAGASTGTASDHAGGAGWRDAAADLDFRGLFRNGGLPPRWQWQRRRQLRGGAATGAPRRDHDGGVRQRRSDLDPDRHHDQCRADRDTRRRIDVHGVAGRVHRQRSVRCRWQRGGQRLRHICPECGAAAHRRRRQRRLRRAHRRTLDDPLSVRSLRVFAGAGRGGTGRRAIERRSAGPAARQHPAAAGRGRQRPGRRAHRRRVDHAVPVRAARSSIDHSRSRVGRHEDDGGSD